MYMYMCMLRVHPHKFTYLFYTMLCLRVLPCTSTCCMYDPIPCRTAHFPDDKFSSLPHGCALMTYVNCNVL